MTQRGVLWSTAQVLRRAWQLYVAHIFLFMIFLAEVSYTVMTFKNPMYNEEMGVGDFLDDPHMAVIQALLLQLQPTFLDILPLYIVLLLIFPAVLLGLRRFPLVVLIPSALIYLEVQIFSVDVPAYPEGHIWTFNPLAWQFLFVVGAALGQAGASSRRVSQLLQLLMWPALIIAAVALVVRLTWAAHGIWDGIPALFLRQLWPVNKTNLSPIRLISFFALVILAARWISPQAAFLRSAAAKPVVLCGAHSLEIFCLSILLSALGHFLLSEFATGVTIQVAVNAVGIAAMCLSAWMFDWYRVMQQMPVMSASAAKNEQSDGGE